MTTTSVTNTTQTPATLLPKFRASFSELANKENADVLQALKLALQIHAVREDATLYLAAHLLAMAQDQKVNAAGTISTGGGFITSMEQMAGQMVQYQNPDITMRSAVLGTSSYGKMFLVLEKGSIAAIGARVYG